MLYGKPGATGVPVMPLVEMATEKGPEFVRQPKVPEQLVPPSLLRGMEIRTQTRKPAMFLSVQVKRNKMSPLRKLGYFTLDSHFDFIMHFYVQIYGVKIEFKVLRCL